MEIYILTIVIIMLLFSFVYLKEYKSCVSLMYIPITGTFIVQNYYYYYGGTVYRVFSDITLNKFILLSSIVLFQIVILMIFSKTIPNKIKIKKIRITPTVTIYIEVIYIVLLIYTIYYFPKFPLITGVLLGDVSRLDTSGNIKFYILSSSIIYFILPSFSFLKKRNKYFILTILFAILSLHKGILFFYIFFYWNFILNRKINKYIFFYLILGGGVYLISKNKLFLSVDNLIYLFESATRRIFITQGSGFIVRLELLNQGFDFLGKDIKKEVFTYIYKSDGGSSPTYFLGSLIIQYGYFISLSIHFVILLLIYITSQFVNNKSMKDKKFWCWIVFSVYYLLMNSDINYTNAFRFLAILLNVMTIFILSKISLKKEKV